MSERQQEPFCVRQMPLNFTSQFNTPQMRMVGRVTHPGFAMMSVGRAHTQRTFFLDQERMSIATGAINSKITLFI